MNRIRATFGILAVVALLLGALVVPATAGHEGFTDVQQNSQSGQAIHWGENNGISRGGWGSTWRPTQTLNRNTGLRWIERYHVNVATEQFASKDQHCAEGQNPLTLYVQDDGVITESDVNPETNIEIEVCTPASD